MLHSLYGVGTDITVTKAPTAGSGNGGAQFNFRQTFGNSSSKSSSTSVNRNTLTSDFTLSSITAAQVTAVSQLKNVAAAAGGLTLTDRIISGNFGSNFTPPTGQPTSGTGNFQGGGEGSNGSSSGGSRTFSGGLNFGNNFTVEGVDLANGELGPLSTGTISTGRTFATADAAKNVALVDSNYATSKKLKVGSTVAIGNTKGVATKFTVIGIVKDSSGTTEEDVYIPLGRAQMLAGMAGKVNTIYVAASSGDKIASVASTIKATVSGATVTDQDTLASQVTGSISSAASLANNLGKWLAIAVLIAAFLLASLLTMSAVSRRVREFGTLKALGWKSRRVVGQVIGESVVIGIVGGVIGVALGFGGAWAVGKFAHPLSASLGSTTGSATPGGAQQFGGFPGGGAAPGGGTNPFRGAFSAAANSASSVTVHLSAPVTITAIILAVGLAVLGGLIAGGFGGWRAARLRPAAALSKVA